MKALSILLLRLLALYFVLTTLYAFIPLLLSEELEPIFGPDTLTMITALLVIPCIAGILIWLFSEKIAGKLHGGEEVSADFNEIEIVRAGIFLVGVYLLIDNLGILISNYSVLGQINYGSLVVALISVFLIFGGTFFVKLYKRIKYFGDDT